ncbi:MAG TPA: hypothetical protein VK541_05055 [Pedobacter sp.]|uniref:hypothetical protein n=1 Tax=Pedobacter sp. TaxID=1411316 RepID=UPI002C9F7BA1|nr:hypothetical protein [Pedobacter sp.]HMI01828.1 hypothetical protein [Pedobacter sp.]
MTKKINTAKAAVPAGENILLEAVKNNNLSIAKTVDFSVLFAAALQVTGEILEAFTKRTEHDDQHDKTSKELQVIIKAVNPADWKTDYKNGSQVKYYPLHWFDSRSGFRFSYYDWSGTYSDTIVGSRFALASSKLADFMGTVFIDKYEILYTS